MKYFKSVSVGVKLNEEDEFRQSVGKLVGAPDVWMFVEDGEIEFLVDPEADINEKYITIRDGDYCQLNNYAVAAGLLHVDEEDVISCFVQDTHKTGVCAVNILLQRGAKIRKVWRRLSSIWKRLYKSLRKRGMANETH